MQECDALLMVGSGLPYAEFLPREGKVRGIQIDLDPAYMSIRYPMEVNLVGDAAATLQALLPHLQRKSDRTWREQIEHNVTEWWQSEDERAHLHAEPINPELLFWECSRRLPDGAIVTADSGTAATWFARAIKMRRGMKASLSGTLATMCPAVPYATVAKLCYPDRVPVGFVGDGAMQMMGLNALITIAKYWRGWSDPRLVIAVLNNRDLNLVTWELRGLGGCAKIEATQSLPEFQYATFAEQIGLSGIRVEQPQDVGPAWDKALSADRPCVIDAVVDPSVPPMPPHVTYEQARNYMAALMKGDREAAATLWHAFRRAWG